MSGLIEITTSIQPFTQTKVTIDDKRSNSTKHTITIKDDTLYNDSQQEIGTIQDNHALINNTPESQQFKQYSMILDSAAFLKKEHEVNSLDKPQNTFDFCSIQQFICIDHIYSCIQSMVNNNMEPITLIGNEHVKWQEEKKVIGSISEGLELTINQEFEKQIKDEVPIELNFIKHAFDCALHIKNDIAPAPRAKARPRPAEQSTYPCT